MSSIVCGCKNCIHNEPTMRTCTLKVVFIDDDGTCGDKEFETPIDDTSAQSKSSTENTSEKN